MPRDAPMVAERACTSPTLNNQLNWQPQRKTVPGTTTLLYSRSQNRLPSGAHFQNFSPAQESEPLLIALSDTVKHPRRRQDTLADDTPCFHVKYTEYSVS